MKTCNSYAPRGTYAGFWWSIGWIKSNRWIPSPSSSAVASSRRGIKNVKWVALVDNVWSRTDQLGGRVSQSYSNFTYISVSLTKCMIWMSCMVLEMDLNTKPLFWKHLSCLESLWCKAAWTVMSAGRNSWNFPGGIGRATASKLSFLFASAL